MATIVVLNGRNEGEWYTIGEQPLVFGRDDTLLAEILDPRVSHRHLEVRLKLAQDRCYATDLHSRNGVKVNGQAIWDETALYEGNTIQIGHTLLAFTEAEFDKEAAAAEFVKARQSVHQRELERISDRDKHTEAIRIFSRMFRRKR